MKSSQRMPAETCMFIVSLVSNDPPAQEYLRESSYSAIIEDVCVRVLLFSKGRPRVIFFRHMTRFSSCDTGIEYLHFYCLCMQEAHALS